MRRKGQNLLEYILIFAMVALVSCAFVTRFDFGKLRNYVFSRPTTSSDNTKINIEAMTD